MGGILPPILGRKDFGGPGEAGEKGGSGRGSAAPSVVVCPLRCELVRAAWADCDETFGGGQGHGQERLSPEPAQSVKVRARKGREIQILAVSHLKKAVISASFMASYGS